MLENRTGKSIRDGGYLDRHPILVPATLFLVCWIPYLVVFLRKTIAFGDLGEPFPIDTPAYWVLFAIQLGVCVISHSLTIRTIIRLYAPRWLIWGSIAFYSLSPAWGLMAAADIRHPLFAAVFCVFTSSCVFTLYSQGSSKWLWVQLAGGALSVSLLRAEGIWIILPTLVFVLVFKIVRWWSLDKSEPLPDRLVVHFRRLNEMQGAKWKKEESRWSDVCASFLVLSAVGLLFLLTYCVGWSLPLGEPDYGSVLVAANGPSVTMAQAHASGFLFANLTGTDDVGGIIPFETILENSVFARLASGAANAILSFQSFPIENITFSWVFYLLLFGAFLIYSVLISFGWKSRRLDFRPLMVGFSMVVIIGAIPFVPTDATLRYLMPILAAQPMFFGAIYASKWS